MLGHFKGYLGLGISQSSTPIVENQIQKQKRDGNWDYIPSREVQGMKYPGHRPYLEVRGTHFPLKGSSGIMSRVIASLE